MQQRFEAPEAGDVTRIAGMLVDAEDAIRGVTGAGLDGTREDLKRIDAVLRSGRVQREARWILEGLGIAFGRVFVAETPGFDWWIYRDSEGRDPCVRLGESPLALFPHSMLAKRIENGETVDVEKLFDCLSRRVAEIRTEA